ncbi:MAG TPA: class I SAM-dependent methyltransferase [Solirubrobacteraceae bacterium]|jgi:2-polyprenyl-3-methyl-5-hydroxy-6-metoxy-1,4-benzoquinol methylase
MADSTTVHSPLRRAAWRLRRRARKRLRKRARALRRRAYRALRIPPDLYKMYALPGRGPYHRRRWGQLVRTAPAIGVEEHVAKVGRRKIEEVTGCHLCGERRVQPLFHRRNPKGGKWNYWVVRCPRCSLLYRSPAVRPEKLHVLYRKKYSRFLTGHYSGTRQERYRMVMDAFDPVFRDGAGRRVLDHGCGTGLFLDVAEERGFEPYGVDLSPDSIDRARERPSGRHAHFGHPLDVPEIAAGGFDVVTLWSVLAHLARPVDDLRMLRGLLADDGVMLILTVNAASLQLKAHREHWGGFTKNHLAVYSPQTLKLLLRLAGFEAVVFRPWYGEAFERGRIPLWPRQARRVRRNVEHGNQGNMMRAVAFADRDAPRRWGIDGAEPLA